MFLNINNHMAKVLHFPKQVERPKVIKGYKMAFYTDQEIDLALLCLNTFGWERIRYDRVELKRTDPMYIKKCLILGYNSQLLSHHSRKLINKIIDSITAYSVTAT